MVHTAWWWFVTCHRLASDKAMTSYAGELASDFPPYNRFTMNEASCIHFFKPPVADPITIHRYRPHFFVFLGDEILPVIRSSCSPSSRRRRCGSASSCTGCKGVLSYFTSAVHRRQASPRGNTSPRGDSSWSQRRRKRGSVTWRRTFQLTTLTWRPAFPTLASQHGVRWSCGE